ncbi:C-C motif chemokine 14-like [Pygocentrus nattereri]|uniref:C-C motif chemokine 14-like n=1 Tax=Pygocentrus nattereri TaxID=42514 RepID=UPI000814387C|nr:C-C motif chemokine 14-like [Pygocentrus nattereri]
MPAEKMEMKMSCVCLVLGLVLLMTVSSDANPHGLEGHPVNCCFNFVTFEIPDKEILEVEKIDSRCSKQGFVITTPRGRLCKKNLQETHVTAAASTEPSRSKQSS